MGEIVGIEAIKAQFSAEQRCLRPCEHCRSTSINLGQRANALSVAGYPPRDGGLLSYGPHLADIFRRAAPYVDRILYGANPAELPVQIPVKFEMALNAKTAKALGLAVPQSILLRADDVIE
jgi:hypothetical protein